MAKSGQKIDELYISLGLDINQLQLDFDVAGKTVSQTISRLNSENNHIKLKTDIDLARLEGAGSELDKLKVKYEAINHQLDIQRQKESVLQAVLRDAQKNYGSDSGLTRRAQTNLLYQQKNIAQMEAEMRKLNAQMRLAGNHAGTFGSQLSNGLAAAKGGVSGLSNGFGLLSAKAAAFMAVATTGAGLFSITEDSMKAGEGIYRLTTRLHTSAAEAAQLSRVFSLTGTDIHAITPLFARLDKQIETAGEKGNATTDAMARFGITLQDEVGNLLPINEQLAQLAKGYQQAAASGQEEAYTAEVLGGRGAALIPVLEQYDDLMEISSHVKTTGLLNPEEAHQAYLKWREMEMEAGQLKLALGSALLPVAEDLMPDVITGFQNLITDIHDNKDSIEELAGVVGTFAQTAVDVLGGVSDALNDIGINAKSVKETLSDVGTLAKHGGVKSIMDGALVGAGTGAAVGTAVAPGAGTAVGLIGGGIIGAFGTYEAATSSNRFADWKKEDEALKQEKKAAQDAEIALRSNQKAKQENARSARELAKATQEAAKANADLTDSIFELTHNDLDNALHAAAKQAEAFRKQGADPGLVNTFQADKQARIYEDFQRNVVDKVNAVYRTDLQNQLANIDQEEQAYRRKGLDEVSASEWAAASKAKVMEQWDNEVASKIDSIWKTELQNRLDEIDREKKAWEQKGLDEVKATRWAEKEKLDAKRNAALEVLRSEKEQMEVFQQYGKAGLAEYIKEQSGFSDEDLRITPEQLQKYQAAKQSVMENILPNFAPDHDRPAGEIHISLAEEAMDKLSGTMATGVEQAMNRLNTAAPVAVPQVVAPNSLSGPTVQVSVNIENAVTQDNEGMRILADTVADRITPAVTSALGSDYNSY
jgi:hypothetical protein